MAKRWISSSHFLLTSMAMVALHLSEATVPAIFIFGDSTVDVGTNNFLPECLVKANKPHNGIDFPYSKPTGRFSNGYNSADFIAKLMGYKRSPPPFLSLLNQTSSFKRKIIQGVNFASGGSGIVNVTGRAFIRVISLEDQVQQFATVQGNITAVMGQAATDSLLCKSMFLISVGSNDLFEYYQRFNSTLSEQAFMTTLQFLYRNHLENLYKLGARKFGIISVPPIGCCPSQRISNNTGGCIDELNEFARTFYTTTEALLQEFSSVFKGVKYSLGNAYEMTINMMDDPLVFGFKDIKTACCGEKRFNGESPCVPTANLCADRSDHLFWDWFHPTQAASKLAALTLYGGAPPLVTPMNFSQLAEVNV